MLEVQKAPNGHSGKGGRRTRPVMYPESREAYRAAFKQWKWKRGTPRLSQEDASELPGFPLSGRHFKRILAGDARPYPAMRDQLAEFFGVDPETLPSTADVDAPFRGRGGS